MKLNESSVSNETSIKETKRGFAVLFNLWKPNGKLQNQWLHPDHSNQCCTFSLSLFCLYVEPAHGSRIDKTLELFGTSSGSVFFSARRDMDEFSAA